MTEKILSNVTFRIKVFDHIGVLIMRSSMVKMVWS